MTKWLTFNMDWPRTTKRDDYYKISRFLRYSARKTQKLVEPLIEGSITNLVMSGKIHGE